MDGIVRVRTIAFTPDRMPMMRRIRLGYEGDNLVERLEFDLPEITAEQTATLMITGADAVTLDRTDEDRYAVDLTRDIIGPDGEREAYVRIDGAGGEVWQSAPMRMTTGALPDVEEEIEKVYPTAVGQMLTAMAEHSGEMQAQEERVEQAAQRAEEAAERAEAGGGSGSGGSTVEIDATLTQAGKAADAKATGDRLSELSKEIGKTILTQKDLAWENKTAYQDSTQNSETRTMAPLIAIGEDKHITITTDEGYDVVCLSFTGEPKFIETTGWANGTRIDTTLPAETKYVRICVRHPDDSEISLDEETGIRIIVGTVLPTHNNASEKIDSFIKSIGFTKLSVVAGREYISVDNTAGTVTIPKSTEFNNNGIHVIVDEPITLPLQKLSNTSSTTILYNVESGTFEAFATYTAVNKSAVIYMYAFTVRRGGYIYKPCIDIGVPYYIDGVLYGGGNGQGSDVSTSLDTAKTKAFAALFHGVDKAESFMFFTDPHLCQLGGDEWREGFDASMLALKKYYNDCPVTRVFCGGDWLGATNSSAADACYRLGVADATMRDCFAEPYMIRGNHESNFDYGGTNGILDHATLRNLMFRKYGNTYYSVNGDNTKFFVFDTQNESDSQNDAELKTEQLVWFADELKANTAENLAIMLHMVYNPYDSETLCGLTSVLLNIASAYNNKTSITVNGVNYDYSTATGKVRFLLGGHSHEDSVATVNGIPVIVTTNLNAGSLLTFDLCLIDYDADNLHMVRVGTGENRTVAI